MAKERQAWLDYVRFFSIFLVIVFHTPPRLPLIDDAVILNLRIPVFFCISGFLYSFDRWKSFSEYALHRARQILIPYTTFFIVFYICHTIPFLFTKPIVAHTTCCHIIVEQRTTCTFTLYITNNIAD